VHLLQRVESRDTLARISPDPLLAALLPGHVSNLTPNSWNSLTRILG